jgi:hypothetical protein
MPGRKAGDGGIGAKTDTGRAGGVVGFGVIVAPGNHAGFSKW